MLDCKAKIAIPSKDQKFNTFPEQLRFKLAGISFYLKELILA